MKSGHEHPPFIIRHVPRRLLLSNLAIPFVWVVAITLSLFLTPDPKGYGTHQQLWLPPCAFHTLTQKLCPTCGLTTSITYITHGDLASAQKAHAGGLLLFVYTGAISLTLLCSFLFQFRIVLPSSWLLLINIMVFGLVIAMGVFRWL
ncbi:MAG: DUF2752 domain-containing protein [Candidatus Nitrosotenuis sp.]